MPVDYDFDEPGLMAQLDELELDAGLASNIGRALSGGFPVDAGECRECGCTEEEPCPGGCIWATPAADLCSRCAREL